MKRVELLINLQAADREWDEKGRRFQVVRAQLADTSEHVKLTAERDQAAQQLAVTRANLRNSELELATLQIKYNEVNKSLYSGRIMNPRELDNLEKESITLRVRLDNFETDTLNLMSEVENLEKQSTEAQTALLAFEEKWRHEQANLTEEYNHLRSRLHALQEQRDRLRGLMNRNDLALYDELRLKKNGNALAQIAGSSCQVCHVSVPSRKVSLVETGEDIVLCEGCGRILFQA